MSDSMVESAPERTRVLNAVTLQNAVLCAESPREERFLERNFSGQYSSYKAQVRRWL